MFKSRTLGCIAAGLVVTALCAVSSANAWELLVTNGYTGGKTVQRYTEAGASLGAFTSGAPFQYAYDICFGTYDDLYATDAVAYKFMRFNDETGVYIDTPGTGLRDIQGIAANPVNGDIYVAHRDPYGTVLGLITRFTVVAPGTSIPVTILPEPGYEGMLSPDGMAFGPDGNLYVAAKDGSNPPLGNVPTVYVFTPDGDLVTRRAIQTIGDPVEGGGNLRGLAIYNGYVYVSEMWAGKVWRVPLAEFNTAPVEDFAKGYTADGAAFSGIKFGPDGKLYVSDWQYHKVLRFNGTTGNYEDTFCTVAGGNPFFIAFKGLPFSEPPELITTLDGARKAPSGLAVQISGGAVSMQMRTSSEPGTPAQPSSFAIQDGPSGIRVISTTPVTPGDRVTVIGRTATVNGERVIDATGGSVTIDSSGGVRPDPVFMSNKVTGGGVYGGQPAVADDASQVPPKMAAGYNTTGIYVKIFGKVTDVVDTSDTTGYFYVDDGSGLKDGTIGQWSGEPRIGMRCGTACSTGWPVLPFLNSYVVVTGVVGVQRVEGINVRYLWTDSFSTVNVQP